ncbi:class II fructose-bisphosphate aldolase, partial [Streptobacillus ratti]|uniref:class II fructose-bisphosphate aldolase n=1 Tax=Streptobacillus ratti TaxID=1720557 RepID=UPI000B2F898B
DIPVALHLDHGPSFEACKDCIEYGFSSVMIDASHYSFDENVELSRSVAEFAHQNDVTVEAELGVLAGVEDDVVAEHSIYTQPDEVEEFVNRTGVDSLAIDGNCLKLLKLKAGIEYPSLFAFANISLVFTNPKFL